jgi:hypothetical protein
MIAGASPGKAEPSFTTSGAKMQAGLALEHGRPVFLLRSLLGHEWAREYAERAGTYVVDKPWAQAGGVCSLGAGRAPKVRRTCSSVAASSSCVASRVAWPRSQRRVAARLRAVQHSSA